MVLQVMLGVDGEVVLEHEYGVLCLFECLGVLGALDDDVSDAVPHLGTCGGGVGDQSG